MVDNFKYLGVLFSCNGKFTECKKQLYLQSQRAMFSIIRKSRLKQLPIDVQLHIFDSTVLPILLYGCEVWGHENVDVLENLQLKFYRYILHLKNSTPICMLRGKLGRISIDCEIKKRMINMWTKLLDATCANKLSNKIYKVLYNMYSSGVYSSPWVLCIEKILNHCGVGHIWQEQNTHGDKWLQEIIK